MRTRTSLVPGAPARDAAEEQAVAVAVAELALDRLDLADHDAGEARGRQRSDARHLDARVDEPVGRVGRAEREVRELPDPAIRDLHASEDRAASRELSQEAEIVVEEEAEVVDAVPEHRDPLDPHAEGPARHLLGV